MTKNYFLSWKAQRGTAGRLSQRASRASAFRDTAGSSEDEEEEEEDFMEGEAEVDEDDDVALEEDEQTEDEEVEPQVCFSPQD